MRTGHLIVTRHEGGLRMMTTPDNGLLSIDRTELLAFYDDPVPREQGMHATAVNAVADEELGLADWFDYARG